MAHRSRLAGCIIDCQSEDLGRAADFWSAALGVCIVDPDQGEANRYVRLAEEPGELRFEVQQIEYEARDHLDIETDDVEAEVARLEKLGAKRVSFSQGRWWVMKTPAGQRFCVVRTHRPELGPGTNYWD